MRQTLFLPSGSTQREASPPFEEVYFPELSLNPVFFLSEGRGNPAYYINVWFRGRLPETLLMPAQPQRLWRLHCAVMRCSHSESWHLVYMWGSTPLFPETDLVTCLCVLLLNNADVSLCSGWDLSREISLKMFYSGEVIVSDMSDLSLYDSLTPEQSVQGRFLLNMRSTTSKSFKINHIAVLCHYALFFFVFQDLITFQSSASCLWFFSTSLNVSWRLHQMSD